MYQSRDLAPGRLIGGMRRLISATRSLFVLTTPVDQPLEQQVNILAQSYKGNFRALQNVGNQVPRSSGHRAASTASNSPRCLCRLLVRGVQWRIVSSWITARNQEGVAGRSSTIVQEAP